MKYGVVLDADLSLIMSNVLSMWNSEFYNEKSNPGNPFLLYYTDDKLPSVGKNVMISNSHFNQSPANSSNLTPIFSSIPETYATIPGYQYDSTWWNLPKTSGKVKTATIQTGYGRSADVTRIGNTVTITSQNQHSSVPANGSWQRGISTLPSGYRPVDDVLIYNHDLSNASKFSWSLLHPNGAIDLFSNGNISTTDYILTSGQFWITKDDFPN